jgi:hypothetical protein
LGGTPVILAPGGDVLRASDGRRLATGLPMCHLGGSPVARGDVVYATYGLPDKRGMVAATRLTLAGDTVTATPLFATERKMYNIASPVLMGDALLVYNYHHLGLYDAQSGSALPFDTGLKLKGDGHALWPSPAVAGDVALFTTNAGMIQVMAVARTWKPIATAQLDPMTASPWFQGVRTYLRTTKALYCFGRQ